MVKIMEAHIIAFKHLKDLHFYPNGFNVILKGDNSVGKSSVIQLLEIALGSKNIPINGDGKASVIIQKDGEPYTLEVKIKDGKSVVTVHAPNGMKDNRKGALTGLIGLMDFDINDFVVLSETPAGRKKQVEIYKSFLPEDIRQSLAQYQANIKANYDSRTETNREIKTLQGAINLNPLVGIQDLDQFKPVDVKEIAATVETDKALNDKRASVVSRVDGRLEKMKDRGTQMMEKLEAIAKLNQELEALKTANIADEDLNKEAAIWLNENPVIDLSEREKQILEASDANMKHQNAQTLKGQLEKLTKLQAEAGEATSLIESESQSIRDTVSSMDIGLPDLTFHHDFISGDDHLTYKGIIVSEGSLSTSEIMELGIKLKMLENPEMGVLFLQRGESLGEDRYNDLLEICAKNNWQLFLEQVERGNKELTIEVMRDDKTEVKAE